MNENINLRPISELPEVESISDGDKLLLNSNGEAKLIDASKVGGSGGGGTIYVEMIEVDETFDNAAFVCYADAEHTQQLTYEEGKKLLIAGAGVYGYASTGELSANISVNFSMLVWDYPYCLQLLTKAAEIIFLDN
jgi:hypothetical protein